MRKYGIDVDKLSPYGQAAARAAERLKSRTILYREDVPVAAVVPISDLDKLDPADPGEHGDDPLLALCGTFSDDAFVDSLSDLERTTLFLREGPPSTQRYTPSGQPPRGPRLLPEPRLPTRSATLRPPAMVKPPREDDDGS